MKRITGILCLGCAFISFYEGGVKEGLPMWAVVIQCSCWLAFAYDSFKKEK